MYFELLNDDMGVSIHMCMYNKDEKGRNLVGGVVSSKDELEHKIKAMVSELKQLQRVAEKYLAY